MASVLETFFFLFESDASKLEKGLDDANKKTEKLEQNLEQTDAAAETVGASLSKLAGLAFTAIGGFAVFGIARQAILQTADAVDMLNDKAEALAIPVDELDAWGRAALMSGGTADGFAGSLERFNEGIVALATTGKGRFAPFAKELGLSMSDIEKGAKDPLFALQKMADKFQELSRTEAAGLGAKLGLDQGTINLLSLGGAGMEELIKTQREFGVVTTEQAEKSAKFNDSLDEWRAQFGTIKREIVTVLLPPLTDFLKMLTRIGGWMVDNKPFVIGFFSAVAAVLIGTYAPAAFAAAKATWALAAPWALAALGVLTFSAAIALVTDDLYAFGQRNDSVTGEIAKKWPWIGDLIRSAGQAMTWVAEIFIAYAGLIMEAITSGPDAAFKNFRKTIGQLVNDVGYWFPMIGEIIQFNANLAIDAIQLLVDMMRVAAAAAKSTFDFIGKGIDFVFGSDQIKKDFEPNAVRLPAPPKAVDEEQARLLKQARIQFSLANTPLASQTSNSIANTRNQTVNKTVQTGPITINSQATDGQKLAAELGLSLNRELKAAIDSTDDGVAG